MVINADKCYFMCLGRDMKNKTFTFDNFFFNNSKEENYLGLLSTTS